MLREHEEPILIMASRSLFIFIFLLSQILYEGNAALLYHHIATNKKPFFQPYKTNIVSSQQQCFAYCMYDRECYAFNINNKEQMGISCHFYNQSTPLIRLSQSEAGTEYYSEFRDCQDWFDFGARASGVYQVSWMSRMMKNVRCNMEIDSGGWMTFQRRIDGSVSFHGKTWDEYKNGFGTPEGEFWLGNDLLHEITSSGNYLFLLTAETFDGEKETSKYGHFYIENENNLYRLHFNVTLLNGIHSLYNAGNGKLDANEMLFSTIDKDNSIGNNECAKVKKRGAFWFNNCHYLRPNGEYRATQCDTAAGLKWIGWKDKSCLKSMKMLMKKLK